MSVSRPTETEINTERKIDISICDQYDRLSFTRGSDPPIRSDPEVDRPPKECGFDVIQMGGSALYIFILPVNRGPVNRGPTIIFSRIYLDSNWSTEKEVQSDTDLSGCSGEIVLPDKLGARYIDYRDKCVNFLYIIQWWKIYPPGKSGPGESASGKSGSDCYS
eukprot:sb/3472667/